MVDKKSPEKGFSAMEILQMKEKTNKPTARPIVYFKDFEKRFDELLAKNKTPRGQHSTISTISQRSPAISPRAGDSLASGDEPKPQTEKKKKPKKKERPKTPVFFENFAPPKKPKKSGLANKKRWMSNPREVAVDLLVQILHS